MEGKGQVGRDWRERKKMGRRDGRGPLVYL